MAAGADTGLRHAMIGAYLAMSRQPAAMMSRKKFKPHPPLARPSFTRGLPSREKIWTAARRYGIAV